MGRVVVEIFGGEGFHGDGAGGDGRFFGGCGFLHGLDEGEARRGFGLGLGGSGRGSRGGSCGGVVGVAELAAVNDGETGFLVVFGVVAHGWF